MDNDCPFCKIARGELETRIVYQDENTVGFIDTLPRFAKGQCVVIHKRHVEQFYELEDKEIAELFCAVKKVAQKLHKVYDPNYVSVFSRGQTVPHVHIIVYPSSPLCTVEGLLKALYMSHQLALQSGNKDLDEALGLIKEA
jgi:histidine triad (HIT) family protein